MKHKHLTLIIVFIALASLLSACGGNAFIPSGWTGITVDSDTAYVSHGQFIYSVNLDNGSEIGRYPDRGQGNKTFYAAPAITPDGNQLLAGSYNNILYSINPQSRTEYWQYETNGHIVGSPTATVDGIYVPSGDHRLYALDENGNERWRFTTGGALWAQPLADEARGLIYISSMDHKLYALNAESGQQAWVQDLGGALVGTPTPSEDGNSLYIGSFGGELISINAENGSINWRSTVEGWVWSGPALFEGRLYFGDLNGHLYAMDAANGQILWQTQPDGPIIGTPLVTEDTIYFTTEAGTIVAINQSGTPVWTQVVGGKIYTSPVIAEDVILVAPVETEARLVALNPNGTQKWSFTPQR